VLKEHEVKVFMGLFGNPRKKIWIAILIILVALVGIFVYQRLQVSFLGNVEGGAVSIIGGADGPTSVFIAGK